MTGISPPVSADASMHGTRVIASQQEREPRGGHAFMSHHLSSSSQSPLISLSLCLSLCLSVSLSLSHTHTHTHTPSLTELPVPWLYRKLGMDPKFLGPFFLRGIDFLNFSIFFNPQYKPL